jgi:hypothetical protein
MKETCQPHASAALPPGISGTLKKTKNSLVSAWIRNTNCSLRSPATRLTTPKKVNKLIQLTTENVLDLEDEIVGSV